MIYPVACMTCKRALGPLIDAFLLKRQKLTEEAPQNDEYRPTLRRMLNEINPGFKSELVAELGDFLRNNLRLEQECCAKTLLTNVTFESLYGK